jgi:hypothetical protein
MNSRRKGKAGENEFAGLVRDHLGVRLCRNLDQTRDGGRDLLVAADEEGPVADALQLLAIEVKRRQRATQHLLERWWAQALQQAEADDLVPCLAYREDRQPWRVVLPMRFVNADLHPSLELQWTMAMSVAGFACVIRELAAV